MMNRAIHVNKIKPVIDRIFHFDEARGALERFEVRENFGKVVITV